MLELGFVRANLEIVQEKLRSRGMDPVEVLGDFVAIDRERREAITRVETLKAERNRLTGEIQALRKSGGDTTAITEETKRLKVEVEGLEEAAAAADVRLREMMQVLPNLPMDSVPQGKDEHGNAVEKTWGEKPVMDFAPRPHWELGEGLGILDFERATKISGARFVVQFGQGALLERALANFMLDLHTREHGYTEVLPPAMVNSKSLFGTGQLPKFAEDLFHCDDVPFEPGQYKENDHWMIPTAEVPVTNLFRDETLEDTQMNVSFCAYTSCYRAEAGSHGRDVRGMIRQHQFQKVELVKFTRPEDSEAEHEALTRHAEAVLEALGLPYRRMLLCTGDMGFSSAKTYDLEVWLPGQQVYREISSCSNFEAFQARRANIKYKPAGAKKPEFLHTINGSGLAVGRTYLAILENYQQADGTVKIPEVLVPYMNGATVIGPQAGRMDIVRKREILMGKLLKSYFFWTYERGSVHYDVMVTAILVFMFGAPFLIDFKDRPVETVALHSSEVLVREAGVAGNSSRFLYQIRAENVGGAKTDAELKKAIVRVIEPISGEVTLERYEPVKDASDHVIAWNAWVLR